MGPDEKDDATFVAAEGGGGEGVFLLFAISRRPISPQWSLARGGGPANGRHLPPADVIENDDWPR